MLFSIGQACRERGNRVVYFAYKKLIDRYKVERIEAAADVGLVLDEAGARAGRSQDRSFAEHRGRDAAYAAGELGPVEIPLAMWTGSSRSGRTA